MSRARNRATWPAAALAAMMAVAATATLAQAHAGQPGAHLPGESNFSDPAPGYGITYDWTVEVIRGGQASLVGTVGAKSWSEPGNPDGLKGSTAGVQWIALDLVTPAKLLIVVERQQGVLFNSIGGATMARGELSPALTLYRGWDDTTETEQAAFDNEGEFWSTVNFLDNAPNPKSKERLVFRTHLLIQGHYTIAIGGNPRTPVAGYPAEDCDPVDQVCYYYTGRHGYRVTIHAK